MKMHYMGMSRDPPTSSGNSMTLSPRANQFQAQIDPTCLLHLNRPRIYRKNAMYPLR